MRACICNTCRRCLCIATANQCCTKHASHCLQELAVAQLRCSKLSELLRAAESGRSSAEDYAKRLEAKFETSARGAHTS